MSTLIGRRRGRPTVIVGLALLAMSAPLSAQVRPASDTLAFNGITHLSNGRPAEGVTVILRRVRGLSRDTTGSVPAATTASTTGSQASASATSTNPPSPNSLNPNPANPSATNPNPATPGSGTTVVSPPTAAAPSPNQQTDSLGHFAFSGLEAGFYEVQLVRPGSRRVTLDTVTIAGPTIRAFALPTPGQVPWWGTVLCIGLFLASILFIRWHNIARSIHVMLVRQLDAVETRLNIEVEDVPTGKIDYLKRIVEGLQKDFNPVHWGSGRRKLGEFLFWSRGRENAAWVALHEVERQLASFLAPVEHVKTHLSWAESQLRVVGGVSALSLADRITVELRDELPTDATLRLSREKERKALLANAISIIYADRDTKFSMLMEWHNKANWLLFTAMILIAFLAFALGNAVLFLAGAAGGFLSRLMRALKRDDVPLDYGASWTTLFLSPVFGAMAGWFGVAMIEFATNGNVRLLGEAFDVVDWEDPAGVVTIAVAFMLGFSERFFDAVVGAVERSAKKAEESEDAARRGPPAGPTLPPTTRTGGEAGAATPGATSAAPAPSERGGVKIDLVDEPVPVGTITGKIILAKAADSDTGVVLSCDSAEYEVKPAAITIAKGTHEATFDVTPRGQAAPTKVRITAQVGPVSVSDAIDFQ
jgi:hypothetical protein